MIRGSKKMRQGFTIIELILVLALVVILATVSLVNLRQRKNLTELNSATSNMAALLREAQSRSASQISDTVWGVHFDNTGPQPFYSLFSGTYSSSSRQNSYSLPATLQFVTSTVAAGSFIEIKFNQISGSLSGTSSTTVAIARKLSPTASSTINVDSSGAISY